LQIVITQRVLNLEAFKMGARHSSRRDLLFNNSGEAGNDTLVALKPTHRSSLSSGKLRSRWSKVFRSHSDRTPAPPCANTCNYDETTATNGSRNYYLTEGCSSVSTSCQTEVQFATVMTQTEHDELHKWKVTNKDYSRFTFDLPSKELDDKGNCSNFDSCQKSYCKMPDDSKLHCIGQESLRHVRLVEAKPYLCDDTNCSSVVYSENHMKEHSCSSDTKIYQQNSTAKYLLSEIDETCNAVENFKSESKVVQESSGISDVHKEIASVGAGMIQLPDKRKQSYSSGSRSVTENAIDLGSSFGSLNSEDMMLETESDHTLSPSNVRSRHSTVDLGPLTHARQMSGCLMNNKYTAVPDCHQVQHGSNEVNWQMVHNVGRKHSAHKCNENLDSLMQSEIAVIDDNIKNYVNGSVEVDEVTGISPAEAICRYIAEDNCNCV